MARYVWFCFAVPKKNLDAYRRMAERASIVWREHGALEYRECVGEDLNVPIGMPFPKGIKTKSDELLYSHILSIVPVLTATR